MDPCKRNRCEHASGPDRTREESPTFVPSIDTGEVFRGLIVDEIRSGRLTPARRRRIVRYAAGLKMSSVEAGRLIAECREELLTSDDPTDRHQALRLVEPGPVRIPVPLKISIVVALAIIAHLVVIGWLR